MAREGEIEAIAKSAANIKGNSTEDTRVQTTRAGSFADIERQRPSTRR